MIMSLVIHLLQNKMLSFSSQYCVKVYYLCYCIINELQGKTSKLKPRLLYAVRKSRVRLDLPYHLQHLTRSVQ